MGLFDDAVPGGGIAKPLMVALGALLVGKMMGGFGQSDTAAPSPAARPSPQPARWRIGRVDPGRTGRRARFVAGASDIGGAR